jgi:hypothetical protein
MKRFISLDFLRGTAIITVLFFHMIQVVWDYEGVLAAGFPWPYWPLVIFLGFLAQFNVLFVALSGLVNTISMDKQWKKFVAQNPTADQKRIMINKILKSQIVRGLFIFIMGYVYGILLDRLPLSLVKQMPDPVVQSLSGLYSTNVLHAIAWGIIISAFVYTQLLRREKGQGWISKRFLLVVLFMLILTPFMVMLSRAFPYFYDDWTTRSVGVNVLYFLVNSIFRGTTPLFPFAVFGVVGAMIGCRISNGNVEKAYANRWFIGSVVVFLTGLFLYLLKVAGLHVILNVESEALLYYFIASVYDVGEKLMVLGGSLMTILIVLYVIDVRGKAKGFAQRIVFVRRFGLVSLTVFSLQWLVALLLIGYHSITNTITGGTTPFLLSNFAAGWFGFEYAPGLTSWELVFWFSITFAIWHIILWLWGKTDFKGSFEWLMIKLLQIGRKDAGQRLNMSASLYNVEPMVDNPQSFWSRRTVIALFIVFFTMATVEVALYAMFL